jgi:hypothetical protein
VGASYPQIPSVIHRKRGVIHSRIAMAGVEGCHHPQIWDLPGHGGQGWEVWILKGDCGGRRNGLLPVAVESLAQGNDLAAEVCILLDQVGDAFAAVQDGGVITPSQHGSDLG